MAMASSQRTNILVIPYPAQGHMLPLLDLTHHLSTLNLSITILTTPKNLPLLSPLLSSSPSIQPLILPFPSHPSLPPNVENAKDFPPGRPPFGQLTHALSFLHLPILNWAHSTPNPPNAIISDFFLGWTLKLAQELSIPRITFSPSGALTIAIGNCLWRDMPKLENSDDVNFPFSFPSIPGSPVYPWYQLSPLFRNFKRGDPLSEFIRDCFLANSNSWGYVFNTFDALEGAYLDHIRRDLGHSRVWAVGPINVIGGCAADRGGPSSVPAGDLLTWLDSCEEGSVVYVCFGSQVVLSPAQAAAVAAGLERSGAKFVWCVKASATTSVVPEGFEERVKGKGLVIKGWAPQVEILSHGSVGSFLTHCGWNSVLEGIAAGVAMLTWPMGADQFYNATLLEEKVRVGVRVCGGRDGMPDPDELARVVAESVRGDREERARAKELRRKALEAVREGGSSYRDVLALVEELNKLNCKQEMS